MSDPRSVVEVRGSKAVKVESLKRWRDFLALLKAEINAGTASLRQGDSYDGSEACEDVCRNKDGVDICGESFVVCGDGSVWILPAV